MASRKQVRAAKRNIKKARRAASTKRTIANLPAATRRDQRKVDAVALGQGAVLVALDQRDPAHPRRQQHADAALQRADHHAAPIEAVGEGARADVAAEGLARAVAFEAPEHG